MERTDQGAKRGKKWWSWGKLAILAVLNAYFYVFMEWLFTVTKPSFMDSLGFEEKAAVFLLCGLIVASICLIPVLLLWATSQLPGLAQRWKPILWIAGVVPAIGMAFTALMLVDNFTYSVFHFGIVTTKGIQRGIYAAGFVILFAVCFRFVFQTLNRQVHKKHLDKKSYAQLYFAALLLVASPLLGSNLYHTDQSLAAPTSTQSASRRPNILLIGSDGLLADHLSLYGYQEDTTPTLKTLAQTSLLAENNFANATITTGSLVSLFTSRLPTETRVIYPPNILQGADAVQHLPGILKNAGYYNAEISVNYYLDPQVLNLQNSFVMVNGDSNTIGRLYTFARRYLPENAAYFLSTGAKRLSDRLFHIFYVRTMEDPTSEVFENEKLSDMTDEDRLGMVKSLFHDIHQPLFIHVHLMGTHAADDMAGYDNEVKTFDGTMQQVLTELKEIGQLDNTLVIVYTDHGFGDLSNVRIPLMIRFPHGEYAGTLTHNTQNMDIAPTILDYLGIQPPAWMDGVSLLKGEPAVDRPIFSASPSFRADTEFHRLELDLSKVKPPFYQFGTVGMVICQKWYAVETSTLTWQASDIQGYPTPCSPDSLPTERQAQHILLDQLAHDGFDVSTLETALGLQTGG